MNPVIAKLHEAQLRKDLPDFRPGDTVRVNVRLKEGEGEKEKERLQAFEGVVISKKGRASGATFTVRRVSFGVGIERIFPLHSPTISSIEVVNKGKVRRRASSGLGAKRRRRRLRRLLGRKLRRKAWFGCPRIDVKRGLKRRAERFLAARPGTPTPCAGKGRVAPAGRGRKLRAPLGMTGSHLTIDLQSGG